MNRVKCSMEYLKRFFSNKKYVRRLTIGFLAVVFLIIAYLVISLILFYNREIKSPNEVPLIYEFGPNTVRFAFDEEASTADISEQFLSYGVSYGIDVSEWQGEIDWERVRATGISFAMIRCGFRQTHGSDVIEDAVFKKNIERATAAGLRVGVYFFGTAKTKEEAIEEAEFTINLIKDYNITYPVVYDIESFNTGRLQNVSYSTISDNVLAFTETVGSYGYETMVYSYHNALSYMLDTGKFEGKLIWLAHFADRTNYKGNYNMWQYTSTGRVDGIKGNVDLNVSYFNYVDSEDQIVADPRLVSVPEQEFINVNEAVKTIRTATMRTGPSSDIPNRLGTIPRGTELIRLGLSDNFSICVYNGRTVYISNNDLVLVN